jgi:nucleotide-binding universal stress UspA family protein
VLAELVLDYLLSAMFVVLGDPLVALTAFVVVVAFVLAKHADLVFAAFVLVLAELVLDYLLSAMLFVLGDPPVALIALVLAKDADLVFIPTAARRRGIPGGGGARGAGSASGSGGTRCARCRSRGAYGG